MTWSNSYHIDECRFYTYLQLVLPSSGIIRLILVSQLVYSCMNDFCLEKWIKLVVTCLSVQWFLPTSSTQLPVGKLHKEDNKHWLDVNNMELYLGGHLLNKLHKTKALIWLSLHTLVSPRESKPLQKTGDTLMYNYRQAVECLCRWGMSVFDESLLDNTRGLHKRT